MTNPTPTTAAGEVDLRSSFAARAARRLDRIAEAGRYRRPVAITGDGPRRRWPDGTELVTFGSNDYLGFAGHPTVVAGAAAAAEAFGAGAGASRLVVGSLPIHDELEAALAAWKNAETAVLFPTGYGANLGVITALAGLVDPEVGTIISDELNHASLIDAIRLTRLRTIVVAHNDVGAYQAALAQVPRGQAIVVTDSVFSMEGDRAPVAALDRLCAAAGALLVLDEAHETWPVAPPVRSEAVRIGTLSKMLGSLGGFCVGPAWLRELVVNTARPYIFSTAPSPASCGAALAALALLNRDDGIERLGRLQENVDVVRPGHTTPIVPFVLGSEYDAVAAATKMRERGVLAPAIRPPAVPVGTSRLRIALSSEHTDADLRQLLDAWADVTRRPVDSDAARPDARTVDARPEARPGDAT